MLNLNLLRVFHAVAKHHSVLKAASTLFVSQPAVSNALRKLQRDSGVRLFEKSGRNLTLSDHGKALYDLTTRLFDVEKEIETLLAQAGARTRPAIHVGLATIYERFGLAEIMRHFSEIDRNISVSIHSGNSRAIMEMLRERTVDMVIAGDCAVDDALRHHFYKKHEVLLVVPKGHSLYGRPAFRAEDIHGERMVLKEMGSSVRDTVDAFLAKFQIPVEPVMELSNIDSILNMVIADHILAFLPDMSISTSRVRGDAFSIARSADEELCFSTYVVFRAPESYPEPTRRVIERFCSLMGNRS